MNDTMAASSMDDTIGDTMDAPMNNAMAPSVDDAMEGGHG